MKPARVAFFDVDETLIIGKSMFGFLRFFSHARGWPPRRYESIRTELAGLADAGMPREETNRLYYRTFAGESVDLVRQLGEEWFRAGTAAGAFFQDPVLTELQRHRDRGDLVVLVSGSFRACLDPIARRVGADRVECTELVAVDGRYTGEVVQPVIGEAKAGAVRTVMAQVGADPRNCVAYGDHFSDLAMLSAVATPVVVGDDRHLMRRAMSAGWRRITVKPGSEHSGSTRE